METSQQSQVERSEKSSTKEILESFIKVTNQISPPKGLLTELGGTIIRDLSISLTRFLQKIGYNRKKVNAYQYSPVILNIGCGDFIKGKFLTTDILPAGGEFLKLIIGKSKLKNELFLDLTYYDKHLSERVDGIVLSHVLEHIPPTLAIESLRNCFHYLKSGGGIRVSVPYLGIYDRKNFPGSQDLKSPMLAKNRLIYGWGHKFMYDPELLTILMEEAGFSEVKEAFYGEGLLSETDNSYRKHQSIYVTGIKA